MTNPKVYWASASGKKLTRVIIKVERITTYRKMQRGCLKPEIVSHCKQPRRACCSTQHDVIRLTFQVPYASFPLVFLASNVFVWARANDRWRRDVFVQGWGWGGILNGVHVKWPRGSFNCEYHKNISNLSCGQIHEMYVSENIETWEAVKTKLASVDTKCCL